MRKGIYLAFLPGESPEEKFVQAAALGFQCVEIPTLLTEAERKRYRQAAVAAGIAIPSVMNSIHWSSPLSDPDPAVRAASREGMLASLATAVEVGADTVLLVPAVVKPEVTYEQAWQRSTAEIEKLLPAYQKAKVCIGIENVGNKFLLSPLEFNAYLDAFGTPYLQAYFDIGNYCAIAYPQHWIRSLGKRLKKVHIKGYDQSSKTFTKSLLASTIDWAEVRQALRDVAYDDVLTAELPGEGETIQDKVRNISLEMDQILAL
ncbi:MAG: sugar phosphate isomerase/epimerase [Lentisphaerae bacterium]|nr:sugar phosphate isomerase/epimerase [Lentisphaerota bacterium]